MRYMNNLKINNSHYCLKHLRRFKSGLQKSQEWNSVVGLEIHAQINTKSKLFSGASTDFGKPVNSCVSFFDCATPGTLPVINKKCVEAGVLTALALSCQLNEVSLFDRKHYFYADLPAGYQITQQRQPLAFNGELKFNVISPGVNKQPYVKVSNIKQLQLEQDSGKSLHDVSRGRSLIDLNRAGVPLMELVFEPDLKNGEEAVALVKELMIILQRLNSCSCKMEEGALRVDANISIHKPTEPFGVRTEVKNLGSIRALSGAINYEISRQINAVKSGQIIINETLSWDADSQKTIPMRDKEKMQDYRFMPEPNLPPLRLHMRPDCVNELNLVDVCKLEAQLPELPEETREKMKKNYGLSSSTVIAIVNNAILTQLFDNIISENHSRNPKTVANILLMELMEFINRYKLDLETLAISSTQLGELIDLFQSKTINLNTVKKVLIQLAENPEKSPGQIVTESKWAQINDDDELTKLCESVIQENSKVATQYKAGKTKMLRALLGEVVKKSSGLANMKKVTEIMEKLLK
ncbi:hypothetical protein PV325_011486 [Microctonus aethiopoides]|uniref:Glutamyl-tRNA(Gln) amidotransferase subunit B, mitochondrial n=1 Tax=Microctonus aethiopoides TaxID=144406 RepID=A0AA39FVM0_9HYME|nr:hypothetical protein PV325_011486 [Microctonus aethiopoides]KAK0176326.1 hypothetical protein PV328_000473 [Microctonus aethiopoides]